MAHVVSEGVGILEDFVVRLGGQAEGQAALAVGVERLEAHLGIGLADGVVVDERGDVFYFQAHGGWRVRGGGRARMGLSRCVKSIPKVFVVSLLLLLLLARPLVRKDDA